MSLEPSDFGQIALTEIRQDALQNGHDCGFIALDTTREEVLAYIRTNIYDIKVQDLLLPEMRTFCAIECVMHKANNSKISETDKRQKLEELLSLSSALLGTVEIESVHDAINKLLSGNDLTEERSILLGSKKGPEIKTVFDDYETVVATQQERLVSASQSLGYEVGKRKNYDELSSIFSNNINALRVSSDDFEIARSLFMEAKQEIDSASTALDGVLRTPEVCLKYIENYYDRDNGWMAFQPLTSGGANSSIVDVVARMKECQIIVWQNSGVGTQFKVTYLTEDFTVSRVTVQRHMRYNGHSHFAKLQIASEERAIDTHNVGILMSPALVPQKADISNNPLASNTANVFRNLVSGLEIVDEKDKILIALDEIVIQIDVLQVHRSVTLDQLQDNDLFTSIQNALFRMSWRSSEISWAVKDALAVKSLAPWKNLEFLAQVLCDETQENPTKSFIVAAFSGEELAQLRASILKAKEIYTIDAHHEKTDYQYAGWNSLSLFMKPSIDSFNHKLMNKHIATIEPLDYTIAIHRSALIEVLAILGECSKNLSKEAKAELLLFRVLESIRDIIEHPKDYKFQADRLEEIESDTSGNLTKLVANELVALSGYLSTGVLPLYQAIDFLNSKSVLSFAEKQALHTELVTMSSSASSKGTRDYNELAKFFNTHPRIDKKEQKELANIIRKLDHKFPNNKADSVVKAVRKLPTPVAADILESALVSFLQPTVALSVTPLGYYMGLLDNSSPLQTKKELDTSFLRYQVSGALEQKLRNYDARRRLYDKATPDQGVSIASLSLDLKVVRIINSVNTSINELIRLVESKSSDSSAGALQLAVQRAFKKVAIVAGELSSEDEIKSGKLNASILPDNLVFLKKLRNIIAHRIFDLDPALFMHTVETIISYMPVDLEEAKTRINNGEDFSTASRIAMTGVELHKHLNSKASQILQACQKFGVTYENMHLVGRAVDKANDIGVQESIIFLLDHALTLNNQLKFEAECKAILGFKVKTYTSGQLQAQVGHKITRVHYNELQLSKKSFVDILRNQHIKDHFKIGKYSYTNDNNEPEYATSLDELDGKQIGLINMSFQDDVDKHHQRNARQAGLLLRKPLIHIIIREKAALLNAELFPVIRNWDFRLPQIILHELLDYFIDRMALENQKTELVKKWFYQEYEQRAWLPGTSKWYAKVEDQYSYQGGFASDTKGVELFIEEPRMMPDAQYNQFRDLHNQIMPINQRMLSITTDENMLNKLFFFVKHLNDPLQLAAILYTTPATELEAGLENLIYDIIVEQFQIPGAISNFDNELFGRKTWFEWISDEYNKRHKSEFAVLIKSKFDAGEYITPVLMWAYKREQLENEATPTSEDGYQELVKFAQNAALYNKVADKHQRLYKLIEDYKSEECYSHKNNKLRNQLGEHTTKIKRTELEKEFGKVKSELVEISHSQEFQAFFEDKLYNDRLELLHNVQNYVEHNVKPGTRTNRGGFIDDFCNSTIPEMQKKPDFDQGLLEQVRIFQSGRYDQWNESFKKWTQKTAEGIVVEYRRKSFFPGLSLQLDQFASNKRPRTLDPKDACSASAESTSSHVSKYQSNSASCHVRS